MIAPDDHARDLGVVALRGRDLQAVLGRVLAERVDDLLARLTSSEPSGRCSPIRSIAATSAFASSGSSRAGRAKLSP